MQALFVNVLNASFYGSIVIAAVLLLRPVLRKAPRSALCLLWLLVGLRLLCPFEIESSLSLQPRTEAVTQIQWEQLADHGQILTEGSPMDWGDEAVPEQPPVSVDTPTVDAGVPVETGYELNWAEALPYLWLTVACGMGLYSLVSYLRLKRRVREAVRVTGNIYACAGLETAFILGYFRPRIYLPMGLEDPEFILDHERSHIRRGDHWFKLVGFLALAVHWFNPLVWVGYLLLCRDLETACDEAVVRDLDLEQRKAYSAALLACSANRRSIAACPVAFGEVSVKARILGVLNYRKPRFWVCLIAVAAIVFVAVCFLTNPAEQPDEPNAAEAGPLPDPGDVPDWVREMTAADVESLEMTVFYSEDAPYRKFSGAELESLVAQLNGCHGTFLANPETIYGYSVTFYLKMQDGTLHMITNNGRYLSIDGVCFDADDGWLATLPHTGEEPIPETFNTAAWNGAVKESQALEWCRLALEEFQSRDTYFLLTESRFSGDILNDNATMFFYRSGNDWVSKTEIAGVDQSTEHWYMEKDGTRYMREVSIIHDPANGEDYDSGWVSGETELQPWLCMFDMDTAEIQSVEASCGDEEDIVIFTAQGSPYQDDDEFKTLGYAATFRFIAGTNTLRSVTLQYTDMWPMLSNDEDVMGTSHVTSTAYPQEMSPEDVSDFIEQCYREAQSQA